MMVKDLVAQLQAFAAQDVKGGDMEVVLFDVDTDLTYAVEPDNNRFDFEVLRGDGEVAIEFGSMSR